MVVPLAETAPAEATSSAETAAEPEVPDIADWPWPGRFGVISVGLGLISVLILPVCLLGYLAFILSGAGLMLGLAGLVGALQNGESASVPLPAGGAGVARRFGTRAVDFPLAGVVACALALVLALLPFLFS
jgi:hypothetical protein